MATSVIQQAITASVFLCHSLLFSLWVCRPPVATHICIGVSICSIPILKCRKYFKVYSIRKCDFDDLSVCTNIAGSVGGQNCLTHGLQQSGLTVSSGISILVVALLRQGHQNVNVTGIDSCVTTILSSTHTINVIFFSLSHQR